MVKPQGCKSAMGNSIQDRKICRDVVILAKSYKVPKNKKENGTSVGKPNPEINHARKFLIILLYLILFLFFKKRKKKKRMKTGRISALQRDAAVTFYIYSNIRKVYIIIIYTAGGYT